MERENIENIKKLKAFNDLINEKESVEFRELKSFIEENELNEKDVVEKYPYAVEYVKYYKDTKNIETALESYFFRTKKEALNMFYNCFDYERNQGKILYQFNINNEMLSNDTFFAYYEQIDEIKSKEELEERRKEENQHMKERLFISEQAIQNFGKNYFENMEENDYRRYADPDGIVELEDGLLLFSDDMDNLYLSYSKDDEVFVDVEELANDEKNFYFETDGEEYEM